jgi:hypothetical protein
MVEHPTVVFLHVMKCGGSSVRAGLAQGIAGSRQGPDVFEYDGRIASAAIPARDGETFGSVGERRVHFADALLPYVILANRPRLILGHFRYRDHFTPLLDGRAIFVTVLRDPVERFVSLYRYRRFGAGVDLPVSVTLPDLIASGRWDHLGHTYVGTFSGDDRLDPSSPAALDAAVANLRRFAVVGFTQDLDGFAGSVSSLVGSAIDIPRLNSSPAPQGHADAEIEPETLAAVAKLCEADRRLYERIRHPEPSTPT